MSNTQFQNKSAILTKNEIGNISPCLVDLFSESPVKISELLQFQTLHPFWQNPLLKACEQGDLTCEDFKYIFSQYYAYSKEFTRYLAGVMFNCGSAYYRAQLIQNLWEESGEKNIQNSHSEIFRRFLTSGLNIDDVENIEFESFTIQFVRENLDACSQEDIIASTAFIAIGIEGIVSRLYKIFIKGLRLAGIDDEHLHFFHLHIGCDDDHAQTLYKMLCSYKEQPDWFEKCQQSVDDSLNLRDSFFTHLYHQLKK